MQVVGKYLYEISLFKGSFCLGECEELEGSLNKEESLDHVMVRPEWP
jgi:hypothetical protein